MPNNSHTPQLIIEKGREAGYSNDLTNCRGRRGGSIIDLISDEKGRDLLTSLFDNQVVIRIASNSTANTYLPL